MLSLGHRRTGEFCGPWSDPPAAANNKNHHAPHDRRPGKTSMAGRHQHSAGRVVKRSVHPRDRDPIAMGLPRNYALLPAPMTVGQEEHGPSRFEDAPRSPRTEIKRRVDQAREDSGASRTSSTASRAQVIRRSSAPAPVAVGRAIVRRSRQAFLFDEPLSKPGCQAPPRHPGAGAQGPCTSAPHNHKPSTSPHDQEEAP